MSGVGEVKRWIAKSMRHSSSADVPLGDACWLAQGLRPGYCDLRFFDADRIMFKPRKCAIHPSQFLHLTNKYVRYLPPASPCPPSQIEVPAQND